MRDDMGYDVDIMIDNHGRARPSLANRQIDAIEEFKLLFFEEPVFDGYYSNECYQNR